MMVAYTDESGNDSRSRVFGMATVVLTQAASFYFAHDWREMLARFEVTEFHASDFYHGRTEFRGWDDQRRTAMETTAVKLLQKWDVLHSAVLIGNDDYQRSFVETGFNKTLLQAISKWRKPYLTAFQHTVQDLREYADYIPKGRYVVPVFDNCQEFIAQARLSYKRNNADGKLGRMRVAACRREYVPLQAADFFVWHHRIDAERYLTTGDRNRGRVLTALQDYSLPVKLWNFHHLEYLRARILAADTRIDPATLPEPDWSARSNNI